MKEKIAMAKAQQKTGKVKKVDLEVKGKSKNRSKNKKTSIGKSRNSRDNSKDGTRERKGRL